VTCDRQAQVHAYHDRQLGPSARESFEAHLAECADCAQLLGEVRAVSRLIASASLPEVSNASISRYYAAWNASQQRGLLRISSWLTAAAAALLIGSLLLRPARTSGPAAPAVAVAVADAGEWEAVALMPPPERRGERPDEFIELAQWMAEDLSDGQLQPQQ
jgi:anti-sigma factor RsiW